MTTVKTMLFADLHRITGRASWGQFLKQFVVGDTYRYNVALRITAAGSGRPGIANRVGLFLGRIWLRRLRRTMGINIPWATTIGPGLLIGHAGGIVVNAAATLGRDCNLSHNVTIGVTRGGRNPGVPTIGHRVYIGPGAVLVGAITVGDDAAIGANAVVTKDVPAGATARGNPAEVFPGRGSGSYVNRRSEPVTR
ncbi:serine O-acetyltransferase [Pseudonocardia lacus]|uniref:serine O-acetyltransferase n=1 Tax=Pseudonocardia lacus TaxID=2835865 RepID=UPI001BDC1FE5|nr:hypothetical protein [Pseudonocardia lacus]